jgi:hypothetical protein
VRSVTKGLRAGTRTVVLLLPTVPRVGVYRIRVLTGAESVVTPPVFRGLVITARQRALALAARARARR